MDAFAVALAWVRAHPDLGVAVAAAERAGLRPLEAAAAIPFVRTEVLRPAARQAWRDREDEVRRALAGEAEVDVVLLGAGPANAAFARALERARPDLAIAVVERGVPGGAFARAGAGFRLNTWSAPGPPGMSLRGEVDLHGGLAVSPAVLSGARFPTGDTLADAALLSWVASACGPLAAEVARVATAGAAVEVRLAVGVPAQLRAGAAVVATGFGTEANRSFDAAGAAFAAAEAARPAAERRVLDAEALFAHAEAAGLATLDGEELAVVGSGPSAMGVLALACGLGPAELTDAPGRFARWRARPRLVWITGARGPASAREARAVWERAGGEARVEPGGMGYVLAESVAALLHELVFLEDIGRLRVLAGRAGSLARGGRGVRIAVDGRAIEADRAVLCTGYVPHVAPLLGRCGSLAELVAGGGATVTTGLVDGAVEPIALTLAGGRVHVIGAAIEEVVTPDESRPPFAESAARAVALATILARSLPPGRGPCPRVAAPALACTPGVAGTARVAVPADRGDAAARPWDRVLAPLDALLAVAPLRFGAGAPPALVLRLVCDASSSPLSRPSSLALRCDGLDDAATAALAARIPPRLAACAARHGGLAIALDLDAGGRVIPALAREHR